MTKVTCIVTLHVFCIFFFFFYRNYHSTPIVSTASSIHSVTTTADSTSITTNSKPPVETEINDKKHQAMETAYIISFIAVASVGGVTEISILLIVIVLLVALVNKTRERRSLMREYPLTPQHTPSDQAYQQILFEKETINNRMQKIV